MHDILEQINEAIPGLTVEISEFGDKKFRNQNFLPKVSLHCQASKHRYVVLYQERDNIWSVSTFLSNGRGHVIFSERLTRTRAHFAVFPMFLEVLLVALNDSVGVGIEPKDAEREQREAVIKRHILQAKQAIKIEASKKREPEVYYV